MSLFEKFKKKESIPQSQPSMDKIYSSYNIDGWYIQLPQEWKMTLDKENEQVIFDVDNEAVNIYISTFNFEKTETGEKANIEAVASFALQAFKLQGAEEYEIFSKYYPEGFATYTSKSITTDKYTTLWDAANRYLHANLPKGTKTLPIAEWEQEYADLKTQRDSDYTKLKETRTEVAELQKIRRCVDIALKAEQPEQIQTRTKRHEQER